MARTVDEEQQRRRRADITRAAATLFAERGFAGTTTAEIARAAGISTGSLFYYYPDKRAVFRSIFEADLPEARERFAAYADTIDPLASLLDIAEAMAAPAREPEAWGLMVELLRQVGEDPELLSVVIATEEVELAGLADLLRRAAEQGQVDQGLDPAEAARWIRTLIDGVFLNIGHRPGYDHRPMLRLIITRFVTRTAPEARGTT